MAFLPRNPAAAGDPPKLQFRHAVDVALSASGAPVKLALTRGQYCCAVALFFGNMGEDDGDGATARWWTEAPIEAESDKPSRTNSVTCMSAPRAAPSP